MNRKTLCIFLALLVSLPVAAALADDDTDELPRIVSVDGVGHVEVTPDMARVTLSVEKRDASLSTAQAGVARVAADIQRLLDNLGIERARVNSTGATVQPDYRWDKDTEQQVLRGYIVQRRFDVEVRNLDVLGDLIDGAVRAGANQVSPPVLDTSRRRDVYRQALANAAADARANARVLAEALGATLGPVVQVSAGGRGRPPVPVARVRQANELVMQTVSVDTSPAYNPGDLRIEVHTSAVFALRP